MLVLVKRDAEELGKQTSLLHWQSFTYHLSLEYFVSLQEQQYMSKLS